MVQKQQLNKYNYELRIMNCESATFVHCDILSTFNSRQQGSCQSIGGWGSCNSAFIFHNYIDNSPEFRPIPGEFGKEWGNSRKQRADRYSSRSAILRTCLRQNLVSRRLSRGQVEINTVVKLLSRCFTDYRRRVFIRQGFGGQTHEALYEIH
jgi:hypothetical protein